VISACADILIERPAEPVFSFVVLDFFKNYQRWSPEVECLELLSPGPVCVGSTGRQVRVDQGRRTDTTFTIVTLEPLQCLEFLELGERYRIRYALEPVPLEADGVAAPAHTRLILSLELKRLSLFMRPFETLIRTAVQEGAERMVESIKGLVELEVPARV
jgi:hypothetical protein